MLYSFLHFFSRILYTCYTHRIYLLYADCLGDSSPEWGVSRCGNAGKYRAFRHSRLICELYRICKMHNLVVVRTCTCIYTPGPIHHSTQTQTSCVCRRAPLYRCCCVRACRMFRTEDIGRLRPFRAGLPRWTRCHATIRMGLDCNREFIARAFGL
jgi:hypothetical protein